MVFLLVFFFWNSYDSNVGAFNIVPEVSEIVLILLIHFSFFLSDSFVSTILSSTSLILSFASVILLLVPTRVFWSQLSHYSLYIDSFFISSRSLLNLSCIFSILVSRLFICDSILFSRFWIIFTIIQNGIKINSLKTRIEKMQEKFNKDLEEIKKESIYD